MSKVLAKVIKDAISSKKCKIGSKEVLHSRSSKLIVCSNSLSKDIKKKIEETAGSARVPIYNFNDTSVQLGRLCNKQFRISVISIETSDSDISAVLEEINKEERPTS